MIDKISDGLGRGIYLFELVDILLFTTHFTWIDYTQISGQRMLQAHSVGKQICNKKDLNEISADI